MHTGRHAEADAVFRKALERDPEDPWVLSHVAFNAAASGDAETAREILQRMQARARRRPLAAELIATVHAGLGENAIALEWLKKSCRARETGVTWIKVHPGFDGLRGDPEYAEVVRCVGLPPDPPRT